MSDQLKGQCPMGCGDTLFVGSGGGPLLLEPVDARLLASTRLEPRRHDRRDQVACHGATDTGRHDRPLACHRPRVATAHTPDG